MKKKTGNELKECASMAKDARDYFWCLRWSAQSAESTLQEVLDSIDSLPKFEDIDVLNRHHYLRNRIRKCIADVFDLIDFMSPAGVPVKKSMIHLQEKIESALRQLEAENGEAPRAAAQPKSASESNQQ